MDTQQSDLLLGHKVRPVCAHGMRNRSIKIIFAFTALAGMMLIGSRAPPLDKYSGNPVHIISRDEASGNETSGEAACKTDQEIDNLVEDEQFNQFLVNKELVDTYLLVAKKVVSFQVTTRSFFVHGAIMYESLLVAMETKINKSEDITDEFHAIDKFVEEKKIAGTRKHEVVNLHKQIETLKSEAKLSWVSKQRRENKEAKREDLEDGMKPFESFFFAMMDGKTIEKLQTVRAGYGELAIFTAEIVEIGWEDMKLDFYNLLDDTKAGAKNFHVYKIEKPAKKKATKKKPSPFASCQGMEEPYMQTFDGKHVAYYSSGDYHIVNSSQISIQGRYLPTDLTNGLAVTKMVAIGGGTLLKDNTLIITPSTVTWNKNPILEDSSHFDELGLLTVDYGNTSYVADTALELSNERPVHVHISDCSKEGLNILVNRTTFSPGNGFLTWRVSMHSQHGQDGYCGNFNEDATDDDRHSVHQRLGKKIRPTGPELLFEPETPDTDPDLPEIGNCPTATLEEALEKCKKGFGGYSCLVQHCGDGSSP
mmetsp:Transcript_120968/g.240982  ORF Transcript_120968/g.240982 Transcript_120968/m.240982 type:complete len:536 (+) Transcript_120968:92-1699(+)